MTATASTVRAPKSVRLRPDALTAIALIAVPAVFTLAFTLLSAVFAYPDILRQPSALVLERFNAGGSGLVALWYVMLAASLLFTAIPTLLKSVFPQQTRGLELSVTIGTLAGLVQALGFARWVFLVPALAATASDPSSPAIFEAFNRYAGMGVGEHLGYLFTGAWTLLIAHALRGYSRVLALSGTVLGVGILAGLLEPAGVGVAGAINAVAYLLWSVWMIAFGVTVWRAPRSG
jgi:hypothetical protein